MDENYRQEQLEQFRSWVLEQTSPEYQLYIRKEDPSVIVLETDTCLGEVSFYPMNIIQLSVKDTGADRHIFFLHFQIHTLEHAKNLFNEMKETILEQAKKPDVRILLCCSSGLTTGFFATKLNESASLLSLDYVFDYVSYGELFRKANSYDLVLLAPQISYAYDDVTKILAPQTVLKIPPKVFASYDVRKLLQEIAPYLNHGRPKKESAVVSRPPIQMPSPRQGLRADTSALIIALLREDEDRFHFASRIYGQGGTILYDKDIIKPRLSLDDVIDLCDTAFALFPHVEMIGLAMPGIINHGHVTLRTLSANETDVVGLLGARYKKKVVLENDANSIALGYYASQDKYSSISLLFQPYIGSCGGVGSICSGQLVSGRCNVAGEVQYLPMYHNPDLSPLWKTPEGAVQLATQTIATIISILGPDLILLSSHLILRADTIIHKLEEYIPQQYLPELLIIKNLREYMLLGMLLTCANTSVD